MIRLPATDDAQIGDHVKKMLNTLDSDIQIRSIEFVGPNVGEELTQGAIYATLATLIMLLLYVGMRFEWRLATGGVLSLAHDVIVTLGAFLLTNRNGFNLYCGDPFRGRLLVKRQYYRGIRPCA